MGLSEITNLKIQIQNHGIFESSWKFPTHDEKWQSHFISQLISVQILEDKFFDIILMISWDP